VDSLCFIHTLVELLESSTISMIIFLYLPDIFTQLVDSSGHMIWSRFEDYLHEVLALPTAVFEKPSFGYNDTAARSCFDMVSEYDDDDDDVVLCRDLLDLSQSQLSLVTIKNKTSEISALFNF